MARARTSWWCVILLAWGVGAVGVVQAAEPLPSTAVPAASVAAAPGTSQPNPPPAAVCIELESALQLLRQAELAAAERRWPDALVDVAAAERGMQAVITRCPAQADQARAVLGPIASRKAEAENGIHQTLCLPAINKAFALDNRAATLQLEKKDWAEVERLLGQAEAAWGDAAAVCKGASRESALANKADSARARGRAALFLGDTAACDPAFADAGRMLDLAKVAWAERQWEDAALWYRKAEMAWGIAAEKCAGPKREQALKKKDNAAVDAHNAVNCAPLWQDATDLSARFKALPASSTPDQKAPLHDRVEVAWSEAAGACRGAPQEKARGYAEAFARERGNAPLSVASQRNLPEPAVASAAAVAAALPLAVSVPAGEAAEKVANSTPVPVPGPVPAPAQSIPVTEATFATPVAKALPPPSVVVAAGDVVPVVTLKAGDTSFIGRFRADASHQTVSGEGQVRWDNGNAFTGTLVQGKAEGRGTMSWINGDRYEGDWKSDLQHGKGSMGYANGDRYEGDFVAGYPAGRGRYLFAATGDRYEGEVVQGKPEGRGSYLWKNGDRFEGSWKAGMKSGPGRYTWASGEFQDGQYVNDVRIDQTAVAQAPVK